MKSKTLKKLEFLVEDIGAITGKNPLLIGAMGYVVQGHLPWSAVERSREMLVCIMSVNIQAITEELRNRGWYVVTRPAHAEILLDNLRVKFISSAQEGMLIPECLCQRVVEVDKLWAMDAPAILISDLINRDGLSIINNLKKPIPIETAIKYLRECKEEIEEKYGPLRYPLVENRLKNFEAQQQKIFNSNP